MTTTICAIERNDIEQIQQLAIDNHMFGPDEVQLFDETIRGHLDGERPDDRWFIAEAQGQVTGAAYVAPEPFGHLVWNLSSIAADPTAQGRGTGTSLISAVEVHLERLGSERARVLLVETSATDQYAGARRSTRRGASSGSPPSGTTTGPTTARSRTGRH